MAKFTDEQRRNAAVIVEVGRALGASQRDLTIALMTALQESGLRNINYGDRDSIGLFQQRDAWGTAAQRMDPAQSARMFFLGGNDGQRGLLDFKNRDQLSLTQAAQAVQVSAFPDAYAKHQSAAEALLGSSPATGGASISTTPGPPTPTVGGEPTTMTAPPVDLSTPQTNLAAEQAKRTAMPTGPVGIGAATAPGLGEASAPGIGAATAPGLGESAAPTAASLGPPTPVTALTRAQFDSTFPDAAATKMFSDPRGANQRRSDVVSAALQWQGVKYLWGGETKDGADCSGFLKTLFAGFGIDLPRLSADQARFGQRVGMNEARPGDILAIDNSSRNGGADHVALALGDNWIMELPRPGLAGRRRRIGANEEGWYGVRIPQLD